MSNLTATEQPAPRGSREVLDRKIIELLAAGHSVTSTAAQCGISVRTIQRRTRNPMFASLVAGARAERLKPLADTAFDAARPALARLVKMSEDESVHPSTRLRALVSVVELSLRLESAMSVEARLAALELATKQSVAILANAMRRGNPMFDLREAEQIYFAAAAADDEPDEPDTDDTEEPASDGR